MIDGKPVPVIKYRDPATNKRCVRKFETEREAYREAEKIDAQLRSGVMVPDSMTVEDFVKSYLAGIEAKVSGGTRSKAYLHNSSAILALLVKAEGQRKFVHFNRHAIKGFLQALLQEKYAHSTVATALGVISAMFAEAIDSELISHNPCRGLMRKLDLSPNQGKALTMEQCGRFLKCVKEKEPKFFLAFSVYILTGMRLGEGLALRREDFDYDTRRLSVSGNATAFGDVTTPKTELSKRDVEIPQELADMIRESLNSRTTSWILCPDWPANPSPKNIKTARNRLRHSMTRVLTETKMVGLGLSIHSLRHTFATLHLEAGANMLWVSRQLGHANIQTTINRYGRGANMTDSLEVERFSSELNDSASKAKYSVRRVAAGV